jgi:catechol 2,3-dioxygenase-like lactoylglutathione lyase family enzyme
MDDTRPMLRQVNLVVRDMARSLAFYGLLGFEVPDPPPEDHVELGAGGLSLELDAAATIGRWDGGWSGATGGTTVLGVSLPTREAVDACFVALVGAGHRAHQVPFDAFFGARYAIVDDPDGNPVGLTSPIDPARKHWPPMPPPSG